MSSFRFAKLFKSSVNVLANQTRSNQTLRSFSRNKIPERPPKILITG